MSFGHSTRAILGRLPVLCLPILFALASCDSDTEPSEVKPREPALRYAFEPGDILRYLTINELAVTGDLIQLEFKEESDDVWRVIESKPDGTTAIAVLCEATAIRMKSPMQREPIEYDSTAPDAEEKLEDPVLAWLASRLGETLSLTIDRQGHIPTLKRDERPASPTRPSGNPFATLGRANLGNEELRRLTETMGVVLPPGPVDVGAAWKHPVSLVVPAGELALVIEYSLVEIVREGERTVALIESRATVDETSLKPAKDGDPMLSQLGLSEGTLAGEIRFDMTAGRVIVSRSEIRLKLDFMGAPIEVRSVNVFEERKASD